MDLQPKFIIEDNALILGKVTFHKHLANDISKVRGGGWFVYHHDSKTFILHGESHQFGKARLEDIQKCVESGEVYTNKSKTHSIAKDFTFYYDKYSEKVKLN